MILWIILGIIALIIIWAIAMYNGLVKAKLKIDNSWSDISVFLKKRYDLIPNLVNTVKGYATHESQTLEKEFLKLKDLPEPTMSFEKTLFNGIFASGKSVMLNDLKNVLYTTMNTARSQLKAEVDKGAYYEKHAGYNSILLKVLGIGVVIYGVSNLTGIWQGSTVWFAFALIASGIIILIFGIFMTRKTRKGTALYQKLAGFKEFIQLVEKDRLQEFLKQDEHYFDKVLPYAIVFDVADKWKDKLESLNVPPPNWYVGNYRN